MIKEKSYGPNQLARMFEGNPNMQKVIWSLWREYYGLYLEKYKKKPEYDDDGNLVDPWLINKISDDISYALALGQDNDMNGNRSFALGQGLVTKSFMEIVLGAYNIIPEGQNAEEWIPTDLLLTLGNGPDKDHRSNVFEIFKNGFFKFLSSIKIGAAPELAEGETRENGTLQWTPENGLEEWDTDHWKPLTPSEPDTITETTENVTSGGKHTHKLEIDRKLITQVITETVQQTSGNNHESFLIENTAGTEVTVASSWTVEKYNEQVGEFKAVVMVRNKALNTIITLMNILSFDYSDAIKVVHQNSMLTDANITLTVGVDAGTSKLYATVAGMTIDNKRIHLCFERCVLGERFFDLEATMELTLEMAATISAYLNVSATSEIQLDMQAVVSTYHNASASPELQLDMLVIPSFYRNLAASSSLILEMLAEVTLIDSISLVDFAVFYNREAVNDSRELAPTGWRVANMADWMDLITFYGGESLAGGDLKALEKWTAPNTGATAASTFKALPAGQRNETGVFSGILLKTIFWIK